MVKIFRISILLFCFFFISISAQSISVSFTSDTTSYKVGDYIKLNLELRYDKKYSVQIPPVKDSIKVLEFIQSMPVDKQEKDGKIIERHKFIFSKYDSGSVTIPSLQISYSESNNGDKKILATTPFAISVTTLKVNTQEEIRDIKEPLSIPLPWWIIGLGILLFLGIIIGAYYGYKYWRKRKLGKIDVKPEIIIPPHEIALAKLEELEQKKLWQNGKVKEFHSEVTGIIREYFEARFNFQALEMPSSEMLSVLSVIDDAKNIFAIAEKFFSNADMVKFAKFEPMPQVNEEMMKQSFEIVKLTIPQVVPETVTDKALDEKGDANVQ